MQTFRICIFLANTVSNKIMEDKMNRTGIRESKHINVLFINSLTQHIYQISRLVVSALLTGHHQTFPYQERTSETYPCI